MRESMFAGIVSRMAVRKYETQPDATFDWSAVIARCLCYLCLKDSKYADAELLDQAAFLDRFGLPSMDRALILGSSKKSLAELARQARKNKAGKNAKRKRTR